MLDHSDETRSGFALRVFLSGGVVTLVLVGLVFLYVPEAPKSLGQEVSLQNYQAGSLAPGEEAPGDEGADASASPRAPEELYETYCAQCHGQSGEGDGPMSRMMASKPPSLKTGPFRMERSPEAVAQIIRMGLGAMPGFRDEISESEALALGQSVLEMAETIP